MQSITPKCSSPTGLWRNFRSKSMFWIAMAFTKSLSTCWRTINSECLIWPLTKSVSRVVNRWLSTCRLSIACWRVWFWRAIGLGITEPRRSHRLWAKTGLWFIWTWWTMTLTITDWKWSLRVLTRTKRWWVWNCTRTISHSWLCRRSTSWD